MWHGSHTILLGRQGLLARVRPARSIRLHCSCEQWFELLRVLARSSVGAEERELGFSRRAQGFSAPPCLASRGSSVCLRSDQEGSELYVGAGSFSASSRQLATAL